MSCTVRPTSGHPSLYLGLTIVIALLLLTVSVRAQTGNEISYVYDELGRLIGVVEPGGDTVIYTYDAVGNLVSVSRRSSALVSIISFTPNGGVVGTTVTIYGNGFSTTPSQNAVTFNGVAATVTSATSLKLVVSVPVGATTGAIAVTTPTGTATSSTPFTVAASRAPTITSFTPTIGAVGTAVSITGTNFEATPFNNRARVNSTRLPISSATATNIAASVAVGATSGRISVGTPNGTVTGDDFFVPPAPYTAADVISTGRMGFGESRTVTIGTSGKIALLVFDGEAGQRMSLKLSGMAMSWVQYTVIKPDATNLIAPTWVNGNSFFDVKTLPATGTYTIVIDPENANTGSGTLTLYDVPPDTVSAITPGGAPVTVTNTVPGQNARLTFNGSANQRVSLKLSGTMGWMLISVVNPDATNLIAPTWINGSGYFDVKTLPANGIYTIVVDPENANLGSGTVQLYDVPADFAGTISIGGTPSTVTVTTPGQNARLTFSGTSGQRITLKLTNGTVGWALVSVNKPDGTALIAPTWTNGSGFFDVKTLPATGTYTILVDPENANVGNATLTLYDVPSDVTSTITPGGSAVSITTTAPGQNARLTFSGNASQRISLKLNGTMGWMLVSVVNPDTTNLIAPTWINSSGYFDVKTLPATGTYTIVIDPENANTGSVTLNLYDVPADIGGTISPDGTATVFTTTVPGQNARPTFSGTSGQRVSLKVSGMTGWALVSIVNPNATNLVAPTWVNGNSFFDVKTLPATGTYTIVVDPENTNTGNVTLTLYDVPADTTSTVTVGGSSVNIATTVPGQNARLTFDATAAQQITVRVTGNNMSWVKVTLLKPDGTSLTSANTTSSNFNLATQTLPTTGTYTISIDPESTNIGSMSVSVTNP